MEKPLGCLENRGQKGEKFVGFMLYTQMQMHPSVLIFFQSLDKHMGLVYTQEAITLLPSSIKAYKASVIRVTGYTTRQD